MCAMPKPGGQRMPATDLSNPPPSLSTRRAARSGRSWTSLDSLKATHNPVRVGLQGSFLRCCCHLLLCGGQWRQQERCCPPHQRLYSACVTYKCRIPVQSACSEPGICLVADGEASSFNSRLSTRESSQGAAISRTGKRLLPAVYVC